MNKFSYDFIFFTRDGFESGTSSINVSSTNTSVDFYCAVLTMCSIDFFDNNSPVGLFGLQTNTIPLEGILDKNCGRSSLRFRDLKSEVFPP